MNFPTDPMRQNDRLIEALCADWQAAGTVTRDTPRADSVIEISRQLREAGDSNKAPASNS